MTPKELKLAAKFLDEMSDVISRRSCEDWNFPEDWTHQEKSRFVSDFHDFNGDPEEYDSSSLQLQGSSTAWLLARKIEAMSKE